MVMYNVFWENAGEEQKAVKMFGKGSTKFTNKRRREKKSSDDGSLEEKM